MDRIHRISFIIDLLWKTLTHFDDTCDDNVNKSVDMSMKNREKKTTSGVDIKHIIIEALAVFFFNYYFIL